MLKNSVKASLHRPIKSSSICTPLIKRCSGGGGTEERARSTAEEFKRVAEEKVKVAAEQGLASQTVEKHYEGGEEAVTEDSPDVENVKKRVEDHKTGDDGDAPVNTVKGA